MQSGPLFPQGGREGLRGPQGFANVLNKMVDCVKDRLRESNALGPRNLGICLWLRLRVKDVSAFRPMMAVTARIYLPKSEQRAEATVNDRGYLLALPASKNFPEVA